MNSWNDYSKKKGPFFDHETGLFPTGIMTKGMDRPDSLEAKNCQVVPVAWETQILVDLRMEFTATLLPSVIFLKGFGSIFLKIYWKFLFSDSPSYTKSPKDRRNWGTYFFYLIWAREISPRSGQIEDPPWPGCCTSDIRIDLSKEILLLYFRYTNVWA